MENDPRKSFHSCVICYVGQNTGSTNILQIPCVCEVSQKVLSEYKKYKTRRLQGLRITILSLYTYYCNRIRFKWQILPPLILRILSNACIHSCSHSTSIYSSLHWWWDTDVVWKSDGLGVEHWYSTN